MSWFYNILNITPREEELQSRIHKLEQEKGELEGYLEELNIELAEAEEWVKCWKSCYLSLARKENECKE